MMGGTTREWKHGKRVRERGRKRIKNILTWLCVHVTVQLIIVFLVIGFRG